MELTKFTDLGLRVLIYLSQSSRETPFTILEISQNLQVSKNHLIKVVHFLSQEKWIVTTRGKKGGLALAKAADQYRLGDVIKSLEKQKGLVNCHRSSCVLLGICSLSGILHQAMEQFFESLNHFTLQTIVLQPIDITLPRILANQIVVEVVDTTGESS